MACWERVGSVLAGADSAGSTTPGRVAAVSLPCWSRVATVLGLSSPHSFLAVLTSDSRRLARVLPQAVLLITRRTLIGRPSRRAFHVQSHATAAGQGLSFVQTRSLSCSIRESGQGRHLSIVVMVFSQGLAVSQVGGCASMPPALARVMTPGPVGWTCEDEGHGDTVASTPLHGKRHAKPRAFCTGAGQDRSL